ncbi:hypothetical protein XM38_005770 [Halomicronema hongdechloris C2206]|uniref:Response regulatory domain-containing protein n=1 Tax=Halomicronema hongdechloris C2206 TaxID=1641165 RepID=A0A1Z3HHB4_9CYAN|nr:response regulator [Halomicronema hongdechloris]ASC69648.1 hypothetical protein XM38_005770 [Halomicronema hongdechloris C2206]
MTLPLNCDSCALPAFAAEEASPGHSGKKRPQVLVVDDDADNLQLACYVAEQAGYAVLSAKTGRQALELIGHQAIDLLLLDVVLPELDGFAVLKRVRAGADQALMGPRSSQALPVIAITALASEADQREIMAAGFNDYLCKPYSIQALESLLARYCPLDNPAIIAPESPLTSQR